MRANLRAVLPGLLFIGSALLPIACNDEVPEAEVSDSPDSCSPTRGCGPGRVCALVPYDGRVVQTCVAECWVGIDVCEDGQFCEDFARDPARGFCTFGCGSDEECEDFLTCDKSVGRCVCGSDDDCNSRLEPMAGESFVCRAGSCTNACRADLDCPCGAICDEGACSVGCRSAGDCCGDSTCEAGRCSIPGKGAKWSNCRWNMDCASGICSSAYPRGLCVDKVVSKCSVGACPEGSACDAVFSPALAETVGVCAPGCRTDVDCRPGTSCIATETPAGGPSEKVCRPTCSADAVCGPNALCDGATSTCQCKSDDACKVYGARATCGPAGCSCVPDCAGRECGDDGCGGTCGSCDPAYTCSSGSCAGSCGTDEPYVVCDGGSRCPPHSTCQPGNKCACDPGFASETCEGERCSNCNWEWTCAVCTPRCDGRQCGDDGCGGTCGTCGDGYDCDSRGQCTGSCGGSTPYVSCGGGSYCPPRSTCETGGYCRCQPGYSPQKCDGTPCSNCSWEWTCGQSACQPDCSGRQCGDDGCGGSCGKCGSGMECQLGRCVSTGGGDDCPGGCPNGYICVNGIGCLEQCTRDGDCSTGCCAGLTDGRRVCADPSYCGGGTGTGGGNTCHDRTSCVTGRVKFPTGLGHCDGKMVGWLKNNCSFPVHCGYCLGTECGMGRDVRANDEGGGELGGMWSCGQSTSALLRYSCADIGDPMACTDVR